MSVVSVVLVVASIPASIGGRGLERPAPRPLISDLRPPTSDQWPPIIDRHGWTRCSTGLTRSVMPTVPTSDHRFLTPTEDEDEDEDEEEEALRTPPPDITSLSALESRTDAKFLPEQRQCASPRCRASATTTSTSIASSQPLPKRSRRAGPADRRPPLRRGRRRADPDLPERPRAPTPGCGCSTPTAASRKCAATACAASPSTSMTTASSGADSLRIETGRGVLAVDLELKGGKVERRPRQHGRADPGGRRRFPPTFRADARRARSSITATASSWSSRRPR